jgi:hypothetical protein
MYIEYILCVPLIIKLHLFCMVVSVLTLRLPFAFAHAYCSRSQ